MSKPWASFRERSAALVGGSVELDLEIFSASTETDMWTSGASVVANYECLSVIYTLNTNQREAGWGRQTSWLCTI